ncbi:MAG: hypothetical protein DME04_12675 [Candidatus Rokuibacteriota bacterium]|nr:MAG: hypothetical protein DME04_12675 [Candidatus Rokubacteria bacterium]
MRNLKTRTWCKIAVIVSAMTLAAMAPSIALAWCGEGRMTGGGSVCYTPGGCVETTGVNSGRVTHGFELHCVEGSDPNNLQINDHVLNRAFHLETLNQTSCFYDPALNPKPPAAGFNTFVGQGFVRLNTDGTDQLYCAQWKFTDNGEPGDTDQATILITDGGAASGVSLCPEDPGGSPNNVICTGNVLLKIGPANLTFGNHQAHKDN